MKESIIFIFEPVQHQLHITVNNETFTIDNFRKDKNGNFVNHICNDHSKLQIVKIFINNLLKCVQ